MSKKFKILGSIALTIVLAYLLYFYFNVIRPSHSFDGQVYKKYLWILKDSARKNIDPLFCYSYAQKQDIYNSFNLKGNYVVIFWEFKSLRNVPLRKVVINQNMYLGDLNFSSGETLNAKSDMPITIKSDYSFKNLMEIDVGTDSKIEKQIKGPNYKGFYGKIKRMALRNENGGDQILFNYVGGPTPTLCLVYKGHKSFFLIVINHIDKPLNPDIIRILNLK